VVAPSQASKNSTNYDRLTRRETQVLRMLAGAMTSKDIAVSLGISLATTNNHIQHVLEKLKVHSRLQAVQRATKAGLL
jgi:DNA-binding CsgD family transcriptional regulator